MSDPFTLAALGIGTSVGGGILSIFQATQAEQLQEQIIRTQQTQLRLQQGQRSLQRMDQLQKTLAQQQVVAAVGNISQASGTFKAIQENSFDNFQQDEHADALNFEGQQLALQQRLLIAKQNMASSIINTISNTGGNIVSTLMDYKKIIPQKTIQKAGININQATTGLRQDNGQLDVNE